MFNRQINKVYNYAYLKHYGQTRKNSGAPYITHPLRVMKFVSIATHDQEILAAALLHDIIEDCYTDDITQRDLILEIRDLFGTNVKNICKELTNRYTKEAYSKLNRQERKVKEAERIATISQDAKLIKCADRIDNLLDYFDNGEMPQYYIKESKELYEIALKDKTGCKYLENLLEQILKY